MTTMTDTAGNDHEIKSAGNVGTLAAIGWKIVDAPESAGRPAPRTEGEWDAIFGRKS